jgi:hypothetical protein
VQNQAWSYSIDRTRVSSGLGVNVLKCNFQIQKQLSRYLCAIYFLCFEKIRLFHKPRQLCRLRTASRECETRIADELIRRKRPELAISDCPIRINDKFWQRTGGRRMNDVDDTETGDVSASCSLSWCSCIWNELVDATSVARALFVLFPARESMFFSDHRCRRMSDLRLLDYTDRSNGSSVHSTQRTLHMLRAASGARLSGRGKILRLLPHHRARSTRPRNRISSRARARA